MKLVIFGLAFLGLVSSRILPTENQKESLREGEVRIDDMILVVIICKIKVKPAYKSCDPL